MWKTVRRQRMGFREKKQHLVVDERPIPWSKTHEAFKTHLETKQWAPNTATPESLEVLRERPPLRPQRQDNEFFSLEELEGALGKLKKNKAPGPDKVSNELLLLMDQQTKTLLLGYYNQIWEHGEAPDSWKEAVVVPIYKGKGADTDPANYRPISLLNAIYKLFAAMLQMRLSDQHDQAFKKYTIRLQTTTRYSTSPLHPQESYGMVRYDN